MLILIGSANLISDSSVLVSDSPALDSGSPALLYDSAVVADSGFLV